MRAHGGVLSLDDLKAHHSTFDTPIKTDYRGVSVWEIPPNGQGITALMALNILEGLDFKGEDGSFYSGTFELRTLGTSCFVLH